jgi:thiol-disulfide isomerase/thioredoxin
MPRGSACGAVICSSRIGFLDTWIHSAVASPFGRVIGMAGSPLIRWAWLLLAFQLIVTVAVGDDGDVKLISQGRPVDFKQHLAPGKYVVFDFYADWCAPCRVLTPRLERLAAQHPERMALRKVDVIDWDSPVVQQMGISSLPYLVLFGPAGELLVAGDPNRVLTRLGNELGGGTAGGRVVGGGPPRWFWATFVTLIVLGSAAVWTRHRRSRDPSRTTSPPSDETSSRREPKIWFVMMDDRLQGPFSTAELGDLRRAGSLGPATRVRRRGDATWRGLDDVLARP